MVRATARTGFGWLALLVSLGALAGDPGQDWPQYRGAARDGVAIGVDAGPTWPDGGPRVAWRIALGSAFSQLAVVADGVYTGISDGESEHLVKLDVATGKEIWRVELGDVFESEFGNGPRATPTLDGDVVYQLGARGTLLAASTVDGRILFRVDLLERFGASVPRFGYSGSPLVVGELLVLEVGSPEKGWLAALDKATGDLLHGLPRCARADLALPRGAALRDPVPRLRDPIGRGRPPRRSDGVPLVPGRSRSADGRLLIVRSAVAGGI